MKILHTADIHLTKRGDERWKALETLLEIGRDKKIEILVISGDLFDKDIDAEDLRPYLRDLFSNNDFKIVLIPGNHDGESYSPGTYFGANATILLDLNTPFEHGDLNIWGMPFEPAGGEVILEKLHGLANKLSPSRKNILLYHGELLDAFFARTDFGEEGEERYMPVKLSYFKDLKIDYVLAGHFHSRFDAHRLESGGYFVYPGSPVSITRRETGKRSVNIFEVGEPPEEWYLDTPHFEEIVVELDPFRSDNPVDIIQGHVESLHPNARAILTVRGFINGAKIELSEMDLVQRIEQIAERRRVDKVYEFKDISFILEDDLFKTFSDKVDQTHHEDEKKTQMKHMAIRAMIKARL